MADANATAPNGLHAFRLAALRSERGRILGMIGLFGAFGVMGVVRIFRPIAGLPEIGEEMLSFSGFYLLLEVLMLRHVDGLIREGRTQRSSAIFALAIAECFFPTLVMFAILEIDGIDPHVLPISPGYAVYFILLTLSTLRADPKLSAVVGVMSVAGYAAFLAYALATAPPEAHPPIPPQMYFSFVIVLAIASAVSVFVTARVRSYIVSVAREGELQTQRVRLDRDLEAAREIQQRLLPESMPAIAGYDLAAMSRSADRTGGDYYDWQAVSDTRVVLSIADVTGHGIGPALVTAACRAYVRATVHGDRVPRDVIERVDALLSDDMPAGRFVTFAMVDLDFAEHRGVFLSAGHGPSYFVRGSDGSVAPIESQGLPLGLGAMGMLEDALTFEFAPGDALVLFSDGFFEWVNGAGEQFGIERLSGVIAAHRGESAAGIVAAMDAAVLAHAGGLPQPDDMTTVVIKRLTAPS